jgi:hypothetical protein
MWRDSRDLRALSTPRQHFPQTLRGLLPEPTFGLDLFRKRRLGVRLHRDIALLPELADQVDRASVPADVPIRIDAADFLESGSGPSFPRSDAASCDPGIPSSGRAERSGTESCPIS